MTQYYFIGTSLTPLHIGSPPELRFSELLFLLQTNLTPKDWNDVVIIRRYYDIENMRRYWREESLDPHGNLDRVALVDRLTTQTGLPDYVLSFLVKYSKTEERIRRFPALLSAYFREEKRQAGGFLADYIAFERTHRLIFLGFRAKRLGRDLTEELQDEDPFDLLIRQLLAQKDAVEYIPPQGYEHLQPLFHETYDDPLAFFQAAIEYRFHHIDALVGMEIFSIKKILGYVVQLILVEEWLELDKKRGEEKLDRILQTGRK